MEIISTSTMKSILVVDDEVVIRKDITEALRAEGYVPLSTSDGKTAIEIIESEMPLVALIDVKLEDMSGLELLQEIKSRYPDTECIMLTGDATQRSAIEAINLGAYGFMLKPFDIDNLLIMISHAVEKKRVKEALLESEAKFRAIFNESSTGIALLDMERKILDVNPAFQSLIGYSADELSEMGISNFTYPDDWQTEKRLFDKMVEGKRSGYGIEKRCICKGGEIVWVFASVSLVQGNNGKPLFAIAEYKDITNRKVADNELNALLKEKKTLLKEIHHRVKNNMQIISSLLSLQAHRITNQQVLELLASSQNRINSIAKIHEKLYMSENFAQIDFSKYVNSYVYNLYHRYVIDTNKIKLNIDTGNVKISIDHAIAFGLIVNELVSNSLKHAFPPHYLGEGEIFISLNKDDDSRIELVVSDNGIGLPEKIDFRNTESLGLHLLTILAEKQLKGKIELNRKKGTTFRITVDTN